MPYKTKFRTLELPRTPEQWASMGSDANSMRSLGAALYRENMQFGTDESRPYPLSTPQQRIGFALSAMDGVVNEYIAKKVPDGVPLARKLNTYIAQGAQRAAKRAGDTETVELVSRMLH